MFSIKTNLDRIMKLVKSSKHISLLNKEKKIIFQTVTIHHYKSDQIPKYFSHFLHFIHESFAFTLDQIATNKLHNRGKKKRKLYIKIRDLSMPLNFENKKSNEA